MRAFLGAATTAGQGTPATGITVLDIDGANISKIGGVDAPDPMYVTLSDDGRVLYATTERDNGQVRAWTVQGTTLTPLGEPRATKGAAPCHLSIHPSGRFLLSACYVSGTLAVNPIHDDGSLGEITETVQHLGTGPHPTRQEGPHAHMIVTDPGTGPGRGRILATDLGTDTVYRYQLDVATGRLSLADQIHTPPGAGPRHLVIRDRFAYVVNELDSTVSVLDLDAGTRLDTVSTQPAGATAVSNPSAIRLSADGRFLYVANRFTDEIAVLAVAGPEVTLRTVVPCGGDHPRDMVLSPDGGYLYSANQFAGTITSFRIDPDTGVPEPVGEPFAIPSPACIVWA